MISDEDIEQVAMSIRMATEIASSATAFIVDRADMAGVSSPLIMMLLREQLDLNITSILRQDLHQWLEHNPNESLDVDEIVKDTIEKLQRLIDNAKETGFIKTKQVQI